MSSQAIQQRRITPRGLSEVTVTSAIDFMRAQRDQLNQSIDQLNQSIAELENLGTKNAPGTGASPPAPAGTGAGTRQATPGATRKPLTAAQRRKISETQKQRWAQKRSQQQKPKAMKAGG